jgi:signal transduction histidine kinase
MLPRRPSLSIRARITLLIFSVSAGVLLLAALSVYIIFDRQLGANLDDTLRLQTAANLELIDSSITPVNLREASDPGNQRAEGESLLRLYDSTGTLLTDQSPVVTSDPAEQALVARVLATGREQFATIDLSANEDYRLLASPIDSNGRVAAVLITGIEWNRVSQPLRILRWILLVTSPLTAIGLAIGAYEISRRALAPVARITETARQIAASPRRLHIAGDDARDELGELAKTLNQMLDQLHDSVDRERQFAADASHELRTPLATMVAAIDVTLSQERDASDYRRALSIARTQSQKLQALSRQLLLLARIDAAERHTGFEDIDFAGLLDAIVESFLSHHHGASVVFDRTETPIEVRGDPELLARAFLNLFENAAIHAGPDVTIMVHCRHEPDGELSIVVGDNGPGIDARLAPYLFRRFHRGVDAAPREGSGLGLAIVESVLRRHGGTIHLIPDSKRGAHFHIRLPRTERAPQGQVPKEHPFGA